ncbi:MAG: glycosyltransferase [Bacteroidales bacterium]|nr:glycosyltransferase [Bacteroidales bacterium]
MNIYIFHYHLNPGGVTRIIELQYLALKQCDPQGSVTVLTGNCPDKEFWLRKGIKIIVNPDLNYLPKHQPVSPQQCENIVGFFRKTCHKPCILHLHNVNLGKNPLVTVAAYKLSSEGYNIVNHAHDFSEDRPENQLFLEEVSASITGVPLQSIMYPGHNNYKYAVLNQFDYNRLSGFGIGKPDLFLLPNPVFLDSATEMPVTEAQKEKLFNTLGLNPSKLLVTYPVRVIRRKNIAEFILLALLFKDIANWVVTQPPKNPAELTEYNQWKTFCTENNIKIFWEAGNKVGFESLIAISDYCITTSIREGFGMAYLEPWLLGTPVIGRDLPMVTEGLKNSGIGFPMLWEKLFVNKQKEIFELETGEQMSLLKKINLSETEKYKILEMNPFLKEFPIKANLALILENKGVILRDYSLEKYGQRLNEIYRKFITHP